MSTSAATTSSAPRTHSAARTPGPGRQAWQRFRRHRPAVISIVLLVAIAAACAAIPVIAALDPYTGDIGAVRQAPSSAHLLGTDGSGRDVLARLLYGGRVSLAVGVVAVAIYVVIGTTLGAIAGYAGGLADSLVMRITDTTMSFPALVIIMAIVPVVGPSIVNIMLIIGLLGWPPVVRLVRGQFLSLREREFVLAARVTGATDSSIVVRHMLPNVVAPLLVIVTFGMADAIIAEAGLSFLGLGVQPPDASWGQMLNGATEIGTLLLRPWMWIPPAVMIAVSILAINFVGDGLRDALDPRSGGGSQ